MWMTMALLVLACGGGCAALKSDIKTVQGSHNFDGTYQYGQTADGTYTSGHGNFDGSSSFSGTIYGTRERGYQDQVDVEIEGVSGRIRLPRITLPVLNGGAGGWFELKNVRMTDRAITANAAVNFINKPTVHIDRVTGSISINGKNGDCKGQCRAIDANAGRQF